MRNINISLFSRRWTKNMKTCCLPVWRIKNVKIFIFSLFSVMLMKSINIFPIGNIKYLTDICNVFFFFVCVLLNCYRMEFYSIWSLWCNAFGIIRGICLNTCKHFSDHRDASKIMKEIPTVFTWIWRLKSRTWDGGTNYTTAFWNN